MIAIICMYFLKKAIRMTELITSSWLCTCSFHYSQHSQNLRRLSQTTCSNRPVHMVSPKRIESLRPRVTSITSADAVSDDVAKAVLLGKYKTIDAALMDFPEVSRSQCYRMLKHLKESGGGAALLAAEQEAPGGADATSPTMVPESPGTRRKDDHHWQRAQRAIGAGLTTVSIRKIAGSGRGARLNALAVTLLTFAAAFQPTARVQCFHSHLISRLGERAFSTWRVAARALTRATAQSFGAPGRHRV